MCIRDRCSPRSHISSTKMCLLAVWKAWSSADLMVAVEPEQWLQISSRPFSHAPFLWTKGNYLKSYLLSFSSGYRGSNSFSSKRRCWICLQVDSGLCCEIEAVGPTWARGCQPWAWAGAPERGLLLSGHLSHPALLWARSSLRLWDKVSKWSH